MPSPTQGIARKKKKMTEFDKDCEIGMLEENEYPLGSGLRAPVKGNLESILWHKIANSNILIEASKFLLHHFEESLLNHRQLKSVINDDLKVWFLGHSNLTLFDFI